MTVRWILRRVAAMLLLALPVMATAGFDEGLTAANRGDFKTALKEWKPLAEQGDATTQYNLGVMYDNGQGVVQDFSQAVAWYRKAADQGYAMAQNNLGVMYGKGQGVAQDYSQAVAWFRKAAEQGHAMAQSNLGVRYEHGQGVAQDYSQAVAWYRRAAEQGHAEAQNNLGVMYGKGQGVAQDYGQAVAWYRKAADQGHAMAQYNLGVMYRNGQGVAQDYSQAVAWYRKAADQGDASAQNNLGWMYENGRGVAQDFVAAYALYNLSAAIDPTQGNKATANRNNLIDRMTPAQIEAGQALTRKMAEKGNVLKALDRYLARPLVVKTKRQAAEPKTTERPASRYPARPTKRPGVVSCNTNCVNGDCYRTYDSGKKVHFQAPLKWNAFSGQMEFDSGPCI